MTKGNRKCFDFYQLFRETTNTRGFFAVPCCCSRPVSLCLAMADDLHVNIEISFSVNLLLRDRYV